MVGERVRKMVHVIGREATTSREQGRMPLQLIRPGPLGRQADRDPLTECGGRIANEPIIE